MADTKLIYDYKVLAPLVSKKCKVSILIESEFIIFYPRWNHQKAADLEVLRA